jgi:outer membrane protein OmpA-like peptidoglycan-associated protein
MLEALRSAAPRAFRCPWTLFRRYALLPTAGVPGGSAATRNDGGHVARTRSRTLLHGSIWIRHPSRGLAMNVNLMEAVSGHISPDLVQKAAAASGESNEGTRTALLGAVPSLFAGLAHGASTPAGISGVLALVTKVATKPKEIGGQGLLANVFGSRSDHVTEALASHSGVKSSSSAGILALIGPLALGAIGKEVASRGLSAGGLADLLFSHKKSIIDNPNTPKGLAGALGLGNLSELGGSAAAVAGPTVSAVENARPSVERIVERPKERRREAIPTPQRPSKWPIMLLPALLLGVLALWGLSNMFRGRPQMPQVNIENPTLRQGTGGVQERQGPPAAAAPQPAAPAEPALNEVHGAPPQMATPEVAHPESALPETNIHFNVASTAMTPDSKASIYSLVTFMKHNQEAVIHVEGFADNTGNPAANETLSVNRAKAVKDALVANGIDSSRIETSGMGQNNPVAPNDNAPDRAHNRRAEITLVH